MVDELTLNASQNLLLGFLSRGDQKLIAAYLKPVKMQVRQVLEEADRPIEYIYFPEGGLVSIVGNSKITGKIEIGMIGKEGMTGLKVVLGDNRSPFQSFVQVAGPALALKTDELQGAMRQSRTMHEIMLRYVQVFMVQTSLTALANAAALLTQRLARWLLMSEDRLDTKNIPLTHEFLSIMLGVRRPAVTIALGELEDRGMVLAKRGTICIVDRPAMIRLTRGTYGVAEREYERRFAV